MHSLLSSVKALYKPLQPAIAVGSKVAYRELQPTLPLSSYIYCYWELKTPYPLHESFYYRVVADGCMDIFFSMDDPTQNYVMGFSRQYTEFPLPESFHYVGVRFLPAMFPLLFGIDAALLSDRFEELITVVPDTAVFIADHIQPTDTLEDVADVLNTYFAAKVGTLAVEPDTRFFEAMERILKGGGNVQVERGLDTGISPRQLRRLFSFYIGDTAKVFSKVIRFQQVLHAGTTVADPRRDKFFFNAGYYDQAHFIKEFRHFYGTTPSQAFGAGDR